MNLIGFGQFAPVFTEGTESVDEAELLLELPHPIPMRPEPSPAPSFIEGHRNEKDYDKEDDEEEMYAHYSQQVSPVPSKKPERFASS